MGSIFPALFVEPVTTTWAMPPNHYDADRQISIETETGLPAFRHQAPTALSCGSSCTSTTTSDSQMGINRGQDDSTTCSDTD